MSALKFRPAELLQDWPAKALSLAAAIALFGFFQLNKLEERPLSIPLSALTNGRFVPASPYPRTVRVVLRGEANVIFAIQERDLKATIDLRAYEAPGLYRVAVSVERGPSAAGIDPLEIRVEPYELAVALEPRAARRLEVVPSFRGFLEPGFELATFSIEPAAVEAAGPEGLLAGLSEVSAEPVDLSGRAADFSVRVKLKQLDPLIELVGEDTVEFKAQVRRAVVFRTVQDLPIEARGLRPGLRLAEPLPLASARISGSRAEIDGFVPSADGLVADLSGIEATGIHAVAVIPRMPPGIAVESWLPMVVTVRVERDDDDGDY